MRYIDRDKNGKITGTFARPQRKGQESLPIDHLEIVAFNNPPKTPAEIQRKRDLAAARAITAEDLADATTIAKIRAIMVKQQRALRHLLGA